jgi:hypothetical protein
MQFLLIPHIICWQREPTIGKLRYLLIPLTTVVLEATMAELERPERLQIMLSAEELEALENWRFEQRMPSRAAAVRELLRRGLAAEGMLRGQGMKSQDFGVIEQYEKRDGNESTSE